MTPHILSGWHQLKQTGALRIFSFWHYFIRFHDDHLAEMVYKGRLKQKKTIAVILKWRLRSEDVKLLNCVASSPPRLVSPPHRLRSHLGREGPKHEERRWGKKSRRGDWNGTFVLTGTWRATAPWASYDKFKVKQGLHYHLFSHLSVWLCSHSQHRLLCSVQRKITCTCPEPKKGA